MIKNALQHEDLLLLINELYGVSKKYRDQEPPYLMRQFCVLQWEEIKTKNSGETHHF